MCDPGGRRGERSLRLILAASLVDVVQYRHGAAETAAWRCYAVLVFLLPIVEMAARSLLHSGGLYYESSCHGRGRRVEATTIDDSETETNGPYSRETGDGAYTQLAKASWDNRCRCHSAISGKQHRRLFWQWFTAWYAYHLLAGRCAVRDGWECEEC